MAVAIARTRFRRDRANWHGDDCRAAERSVAAREDASELYSKNQYNLLALFVKDNIVEIEWDDEVLSETVLTHAGELKVKRQNQLPLPDAAYLKQANQRPKWRKREAGN